MQNQFSTTYAPFVGSSRIDLSHEVKQSFKAGMLVPNLVVDGIPGDHMRLRSEYATRFEALTSPMMHRVNLYSYSFFVPNRLIWRNWKYWITGQQVPVDDGSFIDPVEPTITIDSSNWQKFTKGTLADYLGLPVPMEEPVTPLTISALPFRAYQFIYNEYFRNQDLEPDMKGLYYTDLDYVSGTELAGLTEIRFKWWEKDYFTSSFTEPQSGPPVQLPIDINLQNLKLSYQYTTSDIVYDQNGSSYPLRLFPDADDMRRPLGTDAEANVTNFASIDNSQNLVLSGDSSMDVGTVADLQLVRTIQNFLNLTKRGGERYIEQLKAHFGVTSSDARLQRPEFLGGGKTPVKVGEVLQTNAGADSPIGSYGGRAVAFGSEHGFKSKYLEEHGWIITLETILPRSSYQQGLDRMWSRRDRLDYYWPTFAHLQEQPVYNQELFVNWQNQKTLGGQDYSNEGVFGYQARYMEYRQMHSRVSGEFRDTLSYWHMGRIFTDPPSLDKVFGSTEQSASTFLRPFAIQDGTDYIYQQVYHELIAIRKMPKYVYPKF